LTTAPPKILELVNLQARYPDGSSALRDVTLDVNAAGERVAILGGNGAGKSSLFLVLAGFLEFEGEARVMGLTLDRAHVAAIRRKVGFVFERPEDQLFLDSLAEDVAFGPRNAGLDETEVASRVARALDAVGLRGHEARHPRRLSQGEARLAALATALALEPELLVLDEPTANLDARGRRRVLAALDGFQGSILFLTHDLDAALLTTSRAIVLLEGRVVARGETAAVLGDPRARTALGLEETAPRHAERAPEIDRSTW
jgi:cobalt/nickel transport system ATP-binding protein